MRVLAVIVGAGLVVFVFLGMVDTLVSTRLRTGGHRRFSNWLPSTAWPMFRAVARRASQRKDAAGHPREAMQRREAILSMYPSVILLSLIACWVGFQVLGWALVWWGSGVIDGVVDIGESIYYSGVVYFTVGFGDIVPVIGSGRMLTLVEAFSGVLFIALTVGYLPNLYGSYAQREQALLLLDDGTLGEITPIGLAGELLDGSTDFRDLDAVMGEWERWVVMVLETQTSHPILAYFRSQHFGQSWVTGLGLMADVSAIAIVMRGGRAGTAWRLYRRCVGTFIVMTRSLRLTPMPVPAMTRRHLQDGLEQWIELGWPVPEDQERILAEYEELRAAYLGHLHALLQHLDAPRGFYSAAVPGVRVRGPDDMDEDVVGRSASEAEAAERSTRPDTPSESPPPGDDGEE